MLVSYRNSTPRVGLLVDGRIGDLLQSGDYLDAHPDGLTMLNLIDNWERWEPIVRSVGAKLAKNRMFGLPVADVTLDAPVPRPRRNPFLIAGNYLAHVIAGQKATQVPLTERKQAIFFTKPTGTVVGPTADIEFDPSVTSKVDYEIELVVIIGRAGRDIPAKQALEHVWGYTIGNDVSARDIQLVKPTTDFLRGKGLDTFFPTGPGIVLREDVPDYRSLRLRLWLNGEAKQDALAGEMIRDIPTMIAELSRSLTLERGDLIATGTPSGVLGETNGPWLKDGDELVCEIEGLGRMTNRIRAIH